MHLKRRGGDEAGAGEEGEEEEGVPEVEEGAAEDEEGDGAGDSPERDACSCLPCSR